MKREGQHAEVRLGTPRQWVFQWKPEKQPAFGKWFALAFTIALFAFLITSVRVRVVTPALTVPRKASLIYLQDDARGRALTLRAKEGGPFATRFDLDHWRGLPALESAALAAVQFRPPTHVPGLPPPLPDDPVPPVKIAARGERFFPDRDQETDGEGSPAVASSIKVVPVLYPLGKQISEVLPTELPPLEKMPLEQGVWQFLVRLNASGIVTDCVSVDRADDTGTDVLEKWVRTMQFKPDSTKNERWIPFAVGFINQAADGTDAH